MLLLLTQMAVSAANPDSLTFAVLGNSISTYYDYLPSGYAVYYTQDREKNYGIQVNDTWWMQLSRMSGLTFLANASWSGSRVAADVLNNNSPFLSNHRVKALSRAGVPDFIFIAGGTNDWSRAQVPLGQYRTENFTDSVSFRGAYQRLLWKLTTWYPQTKVICLSIFPRGNGLNEQNAQGWSQADANASIRYIAQQFGQYYIDCTSVAWASNWNLYTLDKLHPSAAGASLLATHIYEKMLSQRIITVDAKRTNEVAEAERLLDISFTADGIVNQGTYQAKVGKHGSATTVYDAANDVYYGCSKAKATDFFYATYDKASPLANAFNSNVTWEMLVRLDGQADHTNDINRTCFLGNEENGGWAFYNSPLGSSFCFQHESGVKSSMKSMSGDTILVSGKFYHLVLTMDRTSHIMRYYINGKLVYTGTRAGSDMKLPQCGKPKGQTAMWICLGGDASAGTYSSNTGAENSAACSFVFARIYDGALSKNAAQGLYNDEVKKFTEPQPSHGTELLMDLELTADSVVNFAQSFPDKPIDMIGDVPIAFNADINQYEAQFSGTKTNFFKYFLGDNPTIMGQLSDAFSVEVYCKNSSSLPLTNTRVIGCGTGYGIGLQMSSRGSIGYSTTTQGNKEDGSHAKTQWSWTQDGILTSDYMHYVIVFDRTNFTSKLYVNGELVSTRWLTFKECLVFEWTPTEWLAIGGDASGTYEKTTSLGSYPFQGDIAMVRIYGKALTSNEVQTLQGILVTREKSYTLGNNGYTSVCLPYVYEVPEGCTAFIVSEVASPSVKLMPIAQAGECVPCGTPVIIKGTAKATITLTALNQNEVEAKYLTPLYKENLLTGTYPGKTLAANEGYYIKTSGANIYRATSNVSLPAFSCYLLTDERRTYYKLEELPVGIEASKTSSEESANKAIYNISGQQVTGKKMPRGIYIQNGKKVAVK